MSWVCVLCRALANLTGAQRVVWCGGRGSFTLPDGTKYTIGDERFRLPEVRALRRGTRRLCSTMW